MSESPLISGQPFGQSCTTQGYPCILLSVSWSLVIHYCPNKLPASVGEKRTYPGALESVALLSIASACTFPLLILRLTMHG